MLTKPVKQAQLHDTARAGCSAAGAAARSGAATGRRRRRRRQPSRRDALVAEDNIVNQKVVAAAARASSGTPPTSVANGAEAVEALARSPYDLVLMDCQMPEMDGFEATRLIREREREARRHYADHRDDGQRDGRRPRACLAAGMDDYLAKPIKTTELQDVLERWTARKRPAVLLPVSS